MYPVWSKTQEQTVTTREGWRGGGFLGGQGRSPAGSAGGMPAGSGVSESLGRVATQMVKHLPTMQETWVQSLGREDPLEKEMPGEGNPLHILAWRIPWTEEPGRLQFMGSQESDTT